MSIRCSGCAIRSFIIGSRLWPPAMIRASGPSRFSDAIAPSTLVARSYSNGAGVCTRPPFPGLGEALADAGVVARLVLLRRVGADDRRARKALRPRLAPLRIEQARREAAAPDVAQDFAGWARGGDRRLAAQAGQGQRAFRVDLADARRLDSRALGEVAEPLLAGARVEAFDEAHRVDHPGLLDEQALERLDRDVEVLVDSRHDVVDGRALFSHIPPRPRPS